MSKHIGWDQKMLYEMTAWKSIAHQNLLKNLLKKSLQNDPTNGGGGQVEIWHDQWILHPIL